MRLVRPTWLAAVSAAALLAFVVTCSPPPAHAQGVPGFDVNKCLAGKTKCVNKKLKGLLQCREKCQKKPSKCGAVQTACETKVMDKFDGGAKPEKGCFAKLEAKDVPGASADKVCTTTGDTATIEAQVDGAVSDLVLTLEGTPPPACTGEAVPATGQTTCYDGDGLVVACAGTGQDGDVQAGAALAYQDNGDGTVTDLNTLLMWEKKSDDGTLSDQDNCYPWRGICSGDGATTCGRDADCSGAGGTCDAGDCQVASPNGLTIFEWVDAMNTATFAGHTDWRVPNSKELYSIVNLENVGPVVSAAFDTGCTPGCTVTTCSCTRSAVYWSATSVAGVPAAAWYVHFNLGFVNANDKNFDNLYVRAVRVGL